MDFLVSNFPVRDVRLFGGNVPGLREEDPVEGWGVCRGQAGLWPAGVQSWIIGLLPADHSYFMMTVIFALL